MIWTYIVVVFLLFLSGMFSGLTLGLMGLDPFNLKRKAKLGNKHAKKIYPIRRHGNLLLCTLLLGNVAVNSALAVFLSSVTTGVIAGVVSTGLIVVFGEIVPQAWFSRYALKLGAKSIWLVKIFMFILYPVTKPLAFLLDKALGKSTLPALNKKEIELILEDQASHIKSDLDEQELEIIKGGLEFSDMKVKDVMTPAKNAFFLEKNDRLSRNLLKQIKDKGHSRIPVFNKTRDRIVGVLFVKDLLGTQARKVGGVMRAQVSFVKDTRPLDSILDLFQKRKTHLFIVNDSLGNVSGIVTLEDVLEEIVGEIVDETDKFTDMRKLK